MLTVFGTRPEAIKMAPVVLQLAKSRLIESVVCSAGQHRELLAQVVEVFGIPTHHDLAVMLPGQTPTQVIAALLGRLGEIFALERPDWVLVHGDTSTALATTLAAFHAGIRIGHVEAGLRSFDLSRPFPEEMNRRVIDRLSDFMFAPTAGARQNLIDEKLDPHRILVTGNTIVDALQSVAARIRQDAVLKISLDATFAKLDARRRIILVTVHRRESFGSPIEEICRALLDAAERFDVEIVFPVHPNPNVSEPVRRILGGRSGIHLIDPQPYDAFVYLMLRSDVILTDSGGIQEEAPAIGRPVLVLREVTERPEALVRGWIELVAPEAGPIVEALGRFLGRLQRRSTPWLAVSSPSMTDATLSDERGPNPFGDGRAAERIVAQLEHLGECPAGPGGFAERPRAPVPDFVPFRDLGPHAS